MMNKVSALISVALKVSLETADALINDYSEFIVDDWLFKSEINSVWGFMEEILVIPSDSKAFDLIGDKEDNRSYMYPVYLEYCEQNDYLPFKPASFRNLVISCIFDYQLPSFITRQRDNCYRLNGLVMRNGNQGKRISTYLNEKHTPKVLPDKELNEVCV